MKCRECGAEMRVVREEWPYPGLPGVTLRGVELRRCVDHPEHHEVELPHLDGLHRALAGVLLTKRTRLTGPEIRCLRELSDLDEAKLAAQLGVTADSVSRWEEGTLGHGGTADRLIRRVAAEALGVPPPRDALEHISDAAAPVQVALRFGLDGWRVVDESDPVSVWVSFADEDREAVLKALEALKVLIHGGGVGTEGIGAGAPRERAALVSPYEDAERALGVAVDTLRALLTMREVRAEP